jgi:hypothetical protein
MDKRGVLFLAGALCALPHAVAGAAPPADPAAAAAAVDGVWVRHERSFTYMGMTSHYSCDGLEYKLKWLLKLSGAREDAVVHGSCSDPMGGPSRISNARMTYFTLALPDSPAATPAADGKNLGHPAQEFKVAPPAPGVGAWKSVDLRAASHRNDIQEGDCELVEQFDRDVLQDFTIRNHESRFTCIPHQVSLNGIQSRFEVLAPLPKAPAQKGGTPKGGAG